MKTRRRRRRQENYYMPPCVTSLSQDNSGLTTGIKRCDMKASFWSIHKIVFSALDSLALKRMLFEQPKKSNTGKL